VAREFLLSHASEWQWTVTWLRRKVCVPMNVLFYVILKFPVTVNSTFKELQIPNYLVVIAEVCYIR